MVEGLLARLGVSLSIREGGCVWEHLGDGCILMASTAGLLRVLYEMLQGAGGRTLDEP